MKKKICAKKKVQKKKLYQKLKKEAAVDIEKKGEKGEEAPVEKSPKEAAAEAEEEPEKETVADIEKKREKSEEVPAAADTEIEGEEGEHEEAAETSEKKGAEADQKDLVMDIVGEINSNICVNEEQEKRHLNANIGVVIVGAVYG
ncbi:cytochrome c1-like [Capsicum galapagoense]